MQVQVRCLCSIWLLSLLAGCGGDPAERRLADYLQRVGNALEVAVPSAGPAQRMVLPAQRQMRLEITAIETIDLLDLLTLRDCALQTTIAERNSSLGKLATDSQRLLLDLRFLEQAPECIALLQAQGKAELARTLVQAVEQKRKLLAVAVWRATLGGPEFRQFWSRPERLNDYPAHTSPAVAESLQNLQRLAANWLAGDYGGGEDLEALLAVVARGDGGALLKALALQQEALARANRMLDQRAEGHPLCLQSRPSPAGRILLTVVQRYFVAGIQPWSSDLSRRHYALWDTLLSLEATLAGGEAFAYRDWRQQREVWLAQALLAPSRHVAHIQPLLSACGLMPGAPAANSP